MLRTGCYDKQMKSIQFFNPSLIIHMRAKVNSSTIANICLLIQTFKYQYFGFQVLFKSILAYNLKTKSDFWSKCPHYIMGYIINLGSMFFLFSLVLNLAYIDYSWCKIWSIYTAMLKYILCDVETIPINTCSPLFNKQVSVYSTRLCTHVRVYIYFVA